jgi:hypothetical protein
MTEDEKQQTEYALAKQVPDMARGCAIQTNYGEIALSPNEAAKLAKVVEKLLHKRMGRK